MRLKSELSTFQSSSVVSMTTSPAHQLTIERALNDGWAAFKRAPWLFVGFFLLGWVLSQIGSLIPVVGVVIAVLVNLWITAGLVRGSWIALEGGTPQFDDFTRLDWPAIGRLFSRQLVLSVLVALILLAASALAFILIGAPSQISDLISHSMNSQMSNSELEAAALTTLDLLRVNALTNPLVWLIVLLTSVIGIVLRVNQAFLSFIALLDGRGPIATIRHGMAVVNPQWWQVLVLLLMQGVIVIIGLFLFCVGVLAAVPLCVCINGAAYRQLFGTEDQAGLLT